MRLKKTSSPIQSQYILNPKKLHGLVVPLPLSLSLCFESEILSRSAGDPFWNKHSFVLNNYNCKVISAACCAWHVDTIPQFESFIAYAEDVPSLAAYIVQYLKDTRLYDSSCEDSCLRAYGFFRNIFVSDSMVFLHVKYLLENVY